MKLSLLLKLQWVYILMGVGYNIVSYWVIQSGGQQLSTTEPFKGGMAMMAYSIIPLLAYGGKFGLYRILAATGVLLFSWNGIIIHLLNYSQDPTQYGSIYSWALAIGINVYGQALALMVTMNLFRREVSED